MKRGTLVAQSVACVLIPLAALVIPWRVPAPRLGLVGLAFSSGVAILNFFLSWVRVPLLQLFGRRRGPIANVSGLPGVGMLVLPALFFVEPRGTVAAWALLVLLVDTGNVIWLTVSV
ncbi:MAG: hypothetical protein AAGA56_01960, partial [Myxococcota bacterium]